MAETRFSKDHEWVRLDGDIATIGITNHAQEALGDIVFVEVPETLRRLRAAGLKTAILSNGSPAMLETAVAGNRIDELLDAVITVEEVGVFKPDPRVYQRAVDRLGVAAAEVSFQSSNSWDAYAASAFGMRVVWCNRYGQKPERLPGKPDHVITTLADLPALLGVALGTRQELALDVEGARLPSVRQADLALAGQVVADLADRPDRGLEGHVAPHATGVLEHP